MGIIKILGTLAITTFIIQIAFSFYYASEILNQNIAFNQSTQRLDRASSLNNQLRIKYSAISSIENLRRLTIPLGLTPIKNTFNPNP